MADSRHRHGAKKRPSSSRYGDGSASQPKIVKNGHGGGYSDFDVSSLPPAPGNVPYPRFSDTNELVVADRSGFAGEIYEQFKHAYKVDNTVEPVKCSMLLDTYVYYRDQNNAVVWKQASSPLLMMTSQKLNTLIKSHRFHYPDQRIILGMPLELSGATLENILAYCHGVPLTIEKTKTVAEKTKFLEFLFIAASYLQIYKLVMDIKQAAIREGIRLEFSEMETFVKELRDPDMLKVFPKDLNDLPSHTREERARSRSGGAPNQMTTAPTMNSYGYANSQPAGYGALPPKPVQPALVPTGLSMPPVPIAPPVAFSDFAQSLNVPFEDYANPFYHMRQAELAAAAAEGLLPYPVKRSPRKQISRPDKSASHVESGGKFFVGHLDKNMTREEVYDFLKTNTKCYITRFDMPPPKEQQKINNPSVKNCGFAFVYVKHLWMAEEMLALGKLKIGRCEAEFKTFKDREKKEVKEEQ